MSTLNKRLDRIENRTQRRADVRYISIPVEDWERLQDPSTPADVRAALEAKYYTEKPVKTYIGIDPDKDWD